MENLSVNTQSENPPNIHGEFLYHRMKNYSMPNGKIHNIYIVQFVNIQTENPYNKHGKLRSTFSAFCLVQIFVLFASKCPRDTKPPFRIDSVAFYGHSRNGHRGKIFRIIKRDHNSYTFLFVNARTENSRNIQNQTRIREK